MMVDMKDRTSNKPSLPPKVEGNPQFILRIQIESLETIHPDIDPYISLAWWGDAQKYILGSPDSQTDRPHFLDILIKCTQKQFQSYCSDMEYVLATLHGPGQVLGHAKIDNLNNMFPSHLELKSVYSIVRSKSSDIVQAEVGRLVMNFKLTPYYETISDFNNQTRSHVEEPRVNPPNRQPLTEKTIDPFDSPMKLDYAEGPRKVLFGSPQMREEKQKSRGSQRCLT
jgi:hypothetical protein